MFCNLGMDLPDLKSAPTPHETFQVCGEPLNSLVTYLGVHSIAKEGRPLVHRLMMVARISTIGRGDSVKNTKSGSRSGTHATAAPYRRYYFSIGAGRRSWPKASKWGFANAADPRGKNSEGCHPMWRMPKHKDKRFSMKKLLPCTHGGAWWNCGRWRSLEKKEKIEEDEEREGRVGMEEGEEGGRRLTGEKRWDVFQGRKRRAILR